MKKNYNYFLSLFVFVMVGLELTFSSVLNGQVTQTFSYTGGAQSFTVPVCVYNMTVDLCGAAGAGTTNAAGGLGGRAQAVMTVTPGEVLLVYVGGAGVYTLSAPTGGYNGGGGHTSSQAGGTGGGGSDIRRGGNAFANRIIVAGGGGGGSNSASQNRAGGAGGGLIGGTGGVWTGWPNSGGQGGTQSAGGAAGVACCQSPTGGGLGVGGNGAGDNAAGCGGGGGYYGGGGGLFGGGGGGSSWLSYAGNTNTSTTSGYQAGDGIVLIKYDNNGSGITASPLSSTICSGNTITLGSSGVPTTTWSNGANTPSISVSPTITTNYTVSGTNTNNCTSSQIFTVNVAIGLPTLSIVSTASAVCPSRTVMLTGSGANSYTWSGGISNGVAFTPTASTAYTLTGTNVCGTSTAVSSVSVNPNPTISITASTASLCSGNTATIIVGGAPNSTISNGVQNGVSFMPQLTTVYTATGSSALGCTATAQTTITVVQTPTAFPGAAPALICLGGTSTISVGGAQGYTWSNGSNQPSFTDSPTITTVYTVTKSNGPCQDIKSVTLTVAPLPFILALTNPTVVCSLKQVTLNAGGAQTYTWAPYGGIGNGLVVTPTVTTIFTVTGNDGTCSNTGTVLLTVLPNPTINIAATSTVLCLGECATLTLGGASTYTWYTAGLTGTSVNQCPTGTTSYSVAGTNPVGCTTGSTKVLVVNPVPNVNVFTNKPMVCSGQGSTLTVNGANTYTWSSGPTGTISVVNPQTTGVYTVTGFLNGTGCNTTKTIQITVFSPTFQVPSTASSCIGGTVNLCASGADSYTWNGNFSFPCISVSPSVYTIYQVSATSTSLNINNSPVSCISSNTVGVSIYLNPTITIAASRTTICKGESTNLTGIGGTTFTWSTFQQGTTVPVSPFVQTTYTVLGADANGCQGTAAIQIKVAQCTGLQEEFAGAAKFMLFPNPNSGEFIISGTSEMDLQLCNELGQIVKVIELRTLNNFKCTVSDLPNGIYLISDKHLSTGARKVVVNK